jgi:hypothetical protein
MQSTHKKIGVRSTNSDNNNTKEIIDTVNSITKKSSCQVNFDLSIFEVDQTKGMVNLTKIAEHFGKKVIDWKRLPNTKKFLKAFFNKNPECENLTVVNGGISSNGTWASRKLALKFAEWISVDFEIYANEVIDELFQTGKVELRPMQPSFNLPQSYEQALEHLISKVRQNTQLTLENEELKPKANYFDIVVNQNPENLSVVETTSRFLNKEKGIKISDVKVWGIMKEAGWLRYQKRSINSKTKHPFPSQIAKNDFWLTTTETSTPVVINKETGEEKVFTNTQILITPIGRLELLKLVQKFINNQSQNLI